MEEERARHKFPLLWCQDFQQQEIGENKTKIEHCDNVGTGQGRTGEMNNGVDENMFYTMLGVNYADDDK